MQKDLSGVQFSIFADVANPSNVLESYTFSFEYSKRISGGEHQLIGLALSGPRGKPVSMTSARSGLEKLVGRLIQIDVTLPDLPG